MTKQDWKEQQRRQRKARKEAERRARQQQPQFENGAALIRALRVQTHGHLQARI